MFTLFGFWRFLLVIFQDLQHFITFKQKKKVREVPGGSFLQNHGEMLQLIPWRNKPSVTPQHTPFLTTILNYPQLWLASMIGSFDHKALIGIWQTWRLPCCLKAAWRLRVTCCHRSPHGCETLPHDPKGMKQHRKQAPTNNLSKTFQDAVSTCLNKTAFSRKHQPTPFDSIPSLQNPHIALSRVLPWHSVALFKIRGPETAHWPHWSAHSPPPASVHCTRLQLGLACIWIEDDATWFARRASACVMSIFN